MSTELIDWRKVTFPDPQRSGGRMTFTNVTKVDFNNYLKFSSNINSRKYLIYYYPARQILELKSTSGPHEQATGEFTRLSRISIGCQVD
jgi:hypothetical protein